MLQGEIIAFGLAMCMQTNATAVKKSDGIVENKRYPPSGEKMGPFLRNYLLSET